MNTITKSKQTLYLIYDGDCILCSNSARAIKIKKSVGELELINARESNPLVKKAFENGYNLNEGIVVSYNNQYFYGADAVHFLALVGSHSDLFNRINVRLFKYKWVSQIFYPIFKAIRNIILFIRKTPPLPPPIQKPLIEKIFGEQTKNIPLILQKRYLNRPYSKDILIMKGKMNITTSKFFQFLSPLFKLSGALVPRAAEKIPVTVELISNLKSNKIIMHRSFYYPNQSPYHFTSKVIHVKDNIVIELMRLGFASRLIYKHDHNKITMEYGGYVLCIGKKYISVPLAFLIGKFYAYEEAISDDQFRMLVKLTHPLFGRIFQYDGYFKIANYNE